MIFHVPTNVRYTDAQYDSPKQEVAVVIEIDIISRHSCPYSNVSKAPMRCELYVVTSTRPLYPLHFSRPPTKHVSENLFVLSNRLRIKASA